MLRVLILALCAVLMTGCGAFKKVAVPESAVYVDQAPLVWERQALDVESYDLGIALSGGGLRSSLYVFGALKALYDEGVLQEADLLSSVSGGGYISYALYTDHAANMDRGDFGEGLFSDAEFPVQACRLATTGNFVTNGQYIRTLFAGFAGFNWDTRAHNLYKDSIFRTYARDEKSRDGLNVREVPHNVTGNNGAKIPFPIFNATLQGCEPNNESCPLDGFARAGIEFTPLWFGSEKLRYQPWDQRNHQETLLTAISVSGAAFARLGPLRLQEQTLRWSDCNNKNDASCMSHLHVSDGGHIENLGALALVRRNTRNIIVIDAEFNKNYSFDGFNILNKRLGAMDHEMTIDSGDDWRNLQPGGHIAKAVHKGRIRDKRAEDTTARKTDIYYLKMSLPASLPREEPVIDWQSGKRAYGEFWNTVRSPADESKEETLDCDSARDYWRTPNRNAAGMEEFLKYIVLSYSECLNSGDLSECGLKFLPSRVLPSRYQFPHFGTEDQSFYLDQSLAYIGLGYLQGKQLGKIYQNR
ncbi:MAG: hypothetical protein QNJ19_14085 [Woeseiaceae bacterium]|nr:hypothetical protein [Woeseiaceae bacterium]